ncbi:hypothetical protein BG011_003001, partial [Mortierella polycephala]
MAANTLTIFCLVSGELASSAFPVELSSEKTVGALKDAIKAKQAPAFDSITANDLVLWSVSIPVSEDDDEEEEEEVPILISNFSKDGKKKLGNPRMCLSKLFPTSPDDNTYILIERPK